MNEYSVKKMSEYPVNPSPLSEDLIPTITVEGGKFVNRNIEFSKLKGDKGDTGPQGEPGDDGNTGASGKAATVEVGSVSTGPAGSSATVENTGDEYDAVLDFTIPKGDKGDQGVVQSVNGQAVEDVVLDATDVGADPTGSASQALQDANDYTDAEVSAIDFPVDSVNGQQGVVVLDTDDVADTDTNRYTNDTDITRLANTSGTNTGDQDLSPYATTTALTNGLATKEPTITAGTTAQYWRGDKTWQTLNKSAVGLGNVDNTSDVNKPVSTAAQTALDGKLDKVTSSNVAPRAYITTASGTQDQVPLYQGSAQGDSIARRTTAGEIFTATPTNSGHATTKAYVDTADALKANRLVIPQFSVPIRDGSVAGSGEVNSFRSYAIAAGANSIPVRDGNGDIFTRQLDISGTKYITGTGFPNGVVTAPVGSIYIDTAVTNGASSWIKKSGTGNTGWIVLEGDSGWRGVTSLFTNLQVVSGLDYGVQWRRVGDIAYIKARCEIASLSTTAFTLPVAMAGSGASSPIRFNGQGVLTEVIDFVIQGVTVYPVPSSTATVGRRGYINAWYDLSTSERASWPTTLPGTAA